MAKASLTKHNIMRKVNRKRNPVTSMAQLAREFGYSTKYWSWHHGSSETSTSAPISFRKRVKKLVGPTVYNKIRDDRYVNKMYR